MKKQPIRLAQTAILAIIFSSLGLIIPLLGVLFGIVGLIFGIITLSTSKKQRHKHERLISILAIIFGVLSFYHVFIIILGFTLFSSLLSTLPPTYCTMHSDVLHCESMSTENNTVQFTVKNIHDIPITLHDSSLVSSKIPQTCNLDMANLTILPGEKITFHSNCTLGNDSFSLLEFDINYEDTSSKLHTASGSLVRLS